MSGWRHAPILSMVQFQRLKFSRFLETCCFRCLVMGRCISTCGAATLFMRDTCSCLNQRLRSRSHKSLCTRFDHWSVPSSFRENFHSTLCARLLVAIFPFILGQLTLHFVCTLWVADLSFFILRQLSLHLQPSFCLAPFWSLAT